MKRFQSYSTVPWKVHYSTVQQLALLSSASYIYNFSHLLLKASGLEVKYYHLYYTENLADAKSVQSTTTCKPDARKLMSTPTTSASIACTLPGFERSNREGWYTGDWLHFSTPLNLSLTATFLPERILANMVQHTFKRTCIWGLALSPATKLKRPPSEESVHELPGGETTGRDRLNHISSVVTEASDVSEAVLDLSISPKLIQNKRTGREKSLVL